MNKHIKDNKRQVVKDAIINVAQEIVIKQGFNALSIRKIADEIDYSIGSIYQYFKNKDEIIKELIEIKYKELIGILRKENNATSHVDSIKGKFISYCEFALNNRDYYREMMLSNNPNVLSMTAVLSDPPTPGMKMLIHYLVSVDKQAGYKVENPSQTAKFLWSSIFGLVIKMIIEDINDFNMVEKHIDLLLKTLKGE